MDKHKRESEKTVRTLKRRFYRIETQIFTLKHVQMLKSKVFNLMILTSLRIFTKKSILNYACIILKY